ncbi:hypothetical protein BH10BDE1_BH10BDE1_18350 [soil metagenome]
MNTRQSVAHFATFLVVALSGMLQSSTQAAPSASSANSKKNEAKVPGPTTLSNEFVKEFRDRLGAKDGKPLDLAFPGEKPNGPALEELRLLAAEALSKEGNTLSAQAVYADVASRAIGTSQGTWALYGLDNLAQEVELDDSALEELAYEYDATPDGNSESAMISWYRAKALLRRGYDEWAMQDLAKVGAETRWHSDRLFDRATDVLSEGKVDEAAALYEDILKRPLVRIPTKQFAELNRARLIFEKGDYEDTLKTVRSLDLPIRERARAMLEMAWARYYLKEYGKALGILTVIDSAFFEALRSPETDVLRMVIDRDLCRYDLIKTEAASFRERYKKPFKQIEGRLKLEDDAQLKQMALQGRFLQRRATLIHRYRTERKAIYDEDIKIAPGLRDFLMKSLLTRERKVEAEISRALPRELDRVASELIEWRDQISFLEYEASIRPLTAFPVDDVDYRPEAASKTRFEKLYWPVVNEAWWDELDSYEVLIRARCAEPIDLTPVVKKATPKPKVQDEEEDEDDE